MEGRKIERREENGNIRKEYNRKVVKLTVTNEKRP